MALTALPSRSSLYSDGYVPPAGLQLTIGALPSYPLATESSQTPDLMAIELARDYLVDPLTYTPQLTTRTSYTNLLLHSGDLTAAAWTKSGATVTANAAANPLDGELNAGALLETATTALHYAQQALALPSTLHTFFAIVRGVGRSHATLRFARDGSNWVQITFPLYTGATLTVATLGSSSGGGNILSLGDDWWLLSIRLTSPGSSSYVRISCSDGTASTYAGDITKGLYVYECGVVAGSVRVPPIHTTSSARTVSLPPVDTDDPFAFLLAESNPQRINSRRATVTRRFRRIPKTQTRFDQQAWPRPEVPGTDVTVGDGSYRLFGTEYLFYRASTAQLFWDAYNRRAVGSDGSVSNAPTGGTFTLTFAGQTTGSIAYNASAATVKTALDALSTVAAVGGLSTVTGAYNDPNGYLATFAARPQITFDASSLTGGTIVKYEQRNSGTNIEQMFLYTNGGVSGGTYTITAFGQTTSSLAWNASRDDIVTALNSLSVIAAFGGAYAAPRDPTPGVIVFAQNGTSGDISIVLWIYLPAFTGTSSLTPLPSAVVCTPQDEVGGAHYLKSTASQTARVLTFTQPHGFTTGQLLYFKQGTTYFFNRTDWTLENITQISVNPAIAPWSDVTAITEVGGFARTYSPGPAIFRARIVSEYFLPGYTALADGTTLPTPAEIPDGAPPLNDTLFLEAVLSGAQSVTLTSGPIQSALGPLITRETTSLIIPI